MSMSVIKRVAPAVLFVLSGACDSGDKDESGNGHGDGVVLHNNGSSDGGLNGSVLDLPDAELSTADALVPTVCADVETTPVRTVPSVSFLVDGSGSMKCVYPEESQCGCGPDQIFKKCTVTGTQSRWQALSAALLGDSVSKGVVDSLGSSIRFGMWIYNQNRGGGTCPNITGKVAPELNQQSAFSAAFPAEPPGDNTPTALALAELVNALPSADQAKAQNLGPQKIVLATDGEPYVCQVAAEAPALDYASVISAVDEARKKGIDVYVISLAPTAGDFAAHLSEVAVKGNTKQAYAPANKAELNTALDDIIASAIPCTVELKGTIEAPEACMGSATLGTQELRCGDANGFKIVDASHVELLGEACRRFKHEPDVALKMSFPCGAFGLQ